MATWRNPTATPWSKQISNQSSQPNQPGVLKLSQLKDIGDQFRQSASLTAAPAAPAARTSFLSPLNKKIGASLSPGLEGLAGGASINNTSTNNSFPGATPRLRVEAESPEAADEMAYDAGYLRGHLFAPYEAEKFQYDRPEEAGRFSDLMDIQQDPGYQFRMQEGQKALERGAAARGNLGSGGHLRDLAQYSQGLASQEYQNAFNRNMGLANLDQARRQGAFGEYAAGRGMDTSQYQMNQSGEIQRQNLLQNLRKERTDLLGGLATRGQQASADLSEMYGEQKAALVQRLMDEADLAQSQAAALADIYMGQAPQYTAPQSNQEGFNLGSTLKTGAEVAKILKELGLE